MHFGPKTLKAGAFESEQAWPFVLHNPLLEDCANYLAGGDSTGKRMLRINGASGTGKTLFSKHLLVSFCTKTKSELALYVDIPATDLEATSLHEKLQIILSRPRSPDLQAPQCVAKTMAKLWHSKTNKAGGQKAGYVYRVSRDLIAQIPAAGPFITAVLPATYPNGLLSQDRTETPLAFISTVSHSKPVLLVLDNFQNLPALMRETIEAELHHAGQHIRLVVINRTSHASEYLQTFDIDGLGIRDIVLEPASREQIEDIIVQVFPSCDLPEGFAETIYRRSEGNLKSVWFQLKLYAERWNVMSGGSVDGSYEGVIQSLTALDTTILRTVVLLLGGISISQITDLLSTLDSRLLNEDVAHSITDLATLGLLIVNSDKRDKVRVEHDMVSRIVDELTPEEEKFELRETLVSALVKMLNESSGDDIDDTLYDRLIGITHEQEVRRNPALQSHIVRFLNKQHRNEKYSYLATLCRDSVCWQVLDILPNNTVRAVLDAIQKCSLFSFGLITTERLKSHSSHAPLAWLYEGKFLAQLFKYDAALLALETAPLSSERDLVEFTIRLNLYENEALKTVAQKKFKAAADAQLNEFDLIILRNSGHLFSRAKAKKMIQVAIDGFERRNQIFGAATARNNLGIVELDDGKLDRAWELFEQASQSLDLLKSPEKYQPVLNMSGIAVVEGDWSRAFALIGEARLTLPPSLMMDQVMFAYNEVAILFLGNTMGDTDPVEAFKRLQQQAARTRDIRFIEVLSWFVQCLESMRLGQGEPKMSPVMADIISTKTARLELFVKADFEGLPLLVPYILSPHWRH